MRLYHKNPSPTTVKAPDIRKATGGVWQTVAFQMSGSFNIIFRNIHKIDRKTFLTKGGLINIFQKILLFIFR